MKRADKNIVINVNTIGIDNKVEVSVNVNKSPIKTPAAVVIALSVISGAAILAVSLCCPEMLVDVVRFIIDIASGS